MESLFAVLDVVEDFIWSYVGFPVILGAGLFLAFRSKFVQIRSFPTVCRNFYAFLTQKSPDQEGGGIHPLQAFFACIGGCVGIGNIVGVTTAAQLGGPGAVFWVWIAAMIGALVKYGEVFLGMRYRVTRPDGTTEGGPMYVLKKAFPSWNWPVKLFCVLMCLYGVEVFQFSAMTSSVSENFAIPKMYVATFFLALVLFAEMGGIKRIGKICSTLIPIFIVFYLSIGAYVLVQNLTVIPGIIVDIFHYAFTPHAAVGAFAGSSIMLAMSQGIRRACYSCDIGVGYASIIHSTSNEKSPSRQASLTIFEVFLDTFIICTMSIIIVLATGTWKEPIPSIYLVQNALSQYMPYMHYFMPVMIFLLGYSTIITYFCAGMKTATFLSPRYGRAVYYVYSIAALMLFSFFDTAQANTLMSFVLACLLALNVAAIIRLRKEIDFKIEPVTQPIEAAELQLSS